MNRQDKIRAYIETTIFNRYFESNREYTRETLLMFEKISRGEIEPCTSAYVVDELLRAPSPKKEHMLELIARYDTLVLDRDDDAENLAEVYVTAGIIPVKFKMDAIHIAMATLYNADCIVSLNFQHINKLKTKMATDAINKLNGLDTPTICTPAEVI